MVPTGWLPPELRTALMLGRREGGVMKKPDIDPRVHRLAIRETELIP